MFKPNMLFGSFILVIIFIVRNKYPYYQYKWSKIDDEIPSI